MINIRIKLLAALALFSFAGSALGYTWVFNNRTDKRVMISMKLTGKGDTRFWYLVSPDRRAIFTWWFPYCYSSIEVTEYKPKSKHLKGFADGEYGDHSDEKLLADLGPAIWETPRILYSRDPASEKLRNQLTAVLSDLAKKGVQTAEEKVSAYMKSDKKEIDKKTKADKTETKADKEEKEERMFQISGEMFDAQLGFVTGLISSGIEKSRCASRTFDLYAGSSKSPVSNKEYTHFALVTKTSEEVSMQEEETMKEEQSKKSKEEALKKEVARKRVAQHKKNQEKTQRSNRKTENK